MVSLVAVAAAGVLGCGDDGSGEDRPTKGEYLRRGDAICARVNPAVIDLPNIQRQVRKLRALPAPEGDEAELDRIYDSADEAIRRAKADPQATAAGRNPFEEPIRLAKAYGFTKCGL